MSDKDDLKIIERVKAGDTEAYSHIVEKYQGMAYRYVSSRFPEDEEAHDLTQEIFISVYEALSSFRGDSKFSTWFYSIMINHCRNYRKKRNKVKVVPLSYTTAGEEVDIPLSDERENPEKSVVMDDSLRIVKEELMKLPEDYREILTMRDIDGLSYNEICDMLNIKMSNVKVRIHRGREMLKNRLHSRGLI